MDTLTSACCISKEEKDAVDAARFGLPDPRELEDDPVLAGCCEEDLRNLRRAEALRQALLDVDRSTARMKLQQQALHHTQQQQQQPQQPCGAEDPEDDDDEMLSELRRRRLEELQRQAAQRHQAADGGYGRLNDVPSGALLVRLSGAEEPSSRRTVQPTLPHRNPTERVEQLDSPGAPAVVHLAVSGCENGAMLDEHLTILAYRYRGTYFARVAIRRSDPLAARLRLEGLPALVCFRSGVVVGRAPVSQFGPPGSLVEEEVTSYLQRLRVVREAPTAGPGSGGHAGPNRPAPCASDDEGDEDEEEWRLKPCDVCGRRYPHEHVRAVYGTCRRRSDSSGDEAR